MEARYNCVVLICCHWNVRHNSAVDVLYCTAYGTYGIIVLSLYCTASGTYCSWTVLPATLGQDSVCMTLQDPISLSLIMGHREPRMHLIMSTDRVGVYQLSTHYAHAHAHCCVAFDRSRGCRWEGPFRSLRLSVATHTVPYSGQVEHLDVYVFEPSVCQSYWLLTSQPDVPWKSVLQFNADYWWKRLSSTVKTFTDVSLPFLPLSLPSPPLTAEEWGEWITSLFLSVAGC